MEKEKEKKKEKKKKDTESSQCKCATHDTGPYKLLATLPPPTLDESKKKPCEIRMLKHWNTRCPLDPRMIVSNAVLAALSDAFAAWIYIRTLVVYEEQHNAWRSMSVFCRSTRYLRRVIMPWLTSTPGLPPICAMLAWFADYSALFPDEKYVVGFIILAHHLKHDSIGYDLAMKIFSSAPHLVGLCLDRIPSVNDPMCMQAVVSQFALKQPEFLDILVRHPLHDWLMKRLPRHDGLVARMHFVHVVPQWTPRKHELFVPYSQKILRTLILGMLRLQKQAPVRKPENGVLVRIDPAVIEEALEYLNSAFLLAY